MVDTPQIYTFEHPRTVRTLRERLVKMRTDYIVQNGEGYAKSFDEYRYRAGHIQGLTDAIAICDDVTGENKK